MNNVLSKLRANDKLKKIAYVSICVFLALYFFSIPSFSGRAKWNIISYFLMGALIGTTIFYILIYDSFKFDKRLLIPLIFIFDALLCTLIFNRSKSGFRLWLTVVLMWVTFVAIYYSCKSIGKYRLILILLMLAFLGFAFYFTIIPEYRSKILHFSFSQKDRLGGYFDNVNLIGSYFAIGFGIALYLGLTGNQKRDYLYCLACLPFLYLGMFTGSRAFIFLVAILFIFLIYIKFKRKKLIFFISVAVFLAILIIMVNVIPFLKEQFEKTLFTLFGIGESNLKKYETSAIERVLWMRYGFELGSKNIVLGYGCGGFSIYSGVGTYSHNNFSEVLCNFGIPGFLFFYFMLLYPGILSLASKKEGSNFVIPFVVYFIVKSMFGVFYSYKDFYLILAFCYFVTDDVKLKDVGAKLFPPKKECITVNI